MAWRTVFIVAARILVKAPYNFATLKRKISSYPPASNTQVLRYYKDGGGREEYVKL